MKRVLKDLPNLMTLGNLACGAIGIERVMAGDLTTAFVLMLVAAVLDFFDGFTARLLGADGEMGKQLDSLADMVTFTVLPGIILYHYTMKFEYCMPNGFCTSRYAWLALPLGGAWRLARFNIDTRQKTGFVGVPTPITGLAFGSLILAFEWAPASWWTGIYGNFYFLTMAPVVAAYLMVSDLPMLAMKFAKNDPLLRWKLALLPVFAAAAFFAGFGAGPVMLAVYVFISIIANFVTKSSHG